MRWYYWLEWTSIFHGVAWNAFLDTSTIPDAKPHSVNGKYRTSKGRSSRWYMILKPKPIVTVNLRKNTTVMVISRERKFWSRFTHATTGHLLRTAQYLLLYIFDRSLLYTSCISTDSNLSIFNIIVFCLGQRCWKPYSEY